MVKAHNFNIKLRKIVFENSKAQKNLVEKNVFFIFFVKFNAKATNAQKCYTNEDRKSNLTFFYPKKYM